MGTIYNISLHPDSKSIEKLKHISKLRDVNSVIGLPDLHMGNLEAPTSYAAITSEFVYPELSSTVVNCGMSVIKTNLETKDLKHENIQDFLTYINQINKEYAPNRADIRGMIKRGAPYIVDKYNLDKKILNHIENQGAMFDNQNHPSLSKIMPPWGIFYKPLIQDDPLPTLGIGNHFIEFQSVDEINNTKAAKKWNIEDNQILITLHGDYRVSSFINYHHSNRIEFRQNASNIRRIKLLLSKSIYHLYRDGIRSFQENINAFNNTDIFTPLLTNHSTGSQYMRAYYGAMNYAYANRLLASILINDALQRVNGWSGEAELLWDVGHDTIQREQHNGQKYWVHRKGAAKAVPSKPTYIAGSYNMDSMLGIGTGDGNKVFQSYDHGTSRVIQNWSNDEYLENKNKTRLYNMEQIKQHDTIQHQGREPISKVVDCLEAEGVLQHVAWLKPVINIR